MFDVLFMMFDFSEALACSIIARLSYIKMWFV
jgi:hypothetical protein